MPFRVAAFAPESDTLTALDRFLVATHRVSERRRGLRLDFDYRLRLEPLGVGGDAPHEGVIVRGKNLSDSGVGFVHDQPLPFRRVLLTAADPTLDALGLVNFQLQVVLRWCRFLGPGQYESGGRLTPVAAA